jgi:hypothetical protein
VAAGPRTAAFGRHATDRNTNPLAGATPEERRSAGRFEQRSEGNRDGDGFVHVDLLVALGDDPVLRRSRRQRQGGEPLVVGDRRPASPRDLRW